MEALNLWVEIYSNFVKYMVLPVLTEPFGVTHINWLRFWAPSILDKILVVFFPPACEIIYHLSK